MTRRGLLAGAGWLATLRAPSASPRTRPAELAPERQHVFAALVAALADAPALRLPPTVAAEATDRFVGRYARLPPARRRDVDRVLDALGLPFVDLAPHERLALLRSGAEPELAAQALALAHADLRGPDADGREVLLG